MQQAVLEMYRKGKITIRQGAEMLGVTYWEMNELLREDQTPLVSDIALAFRRGARPSRRSRRR